MEKKYSFAKPEMVETEKVGMVTYRLLNYEVRETSIEEMLELWEEFSKDMEELPTEPEQLFKDEHKWQYFQVRFPIGIWSKDKIVEAIIRDKYSQDEMEAITNNMAAINAVFMQTLVTDGIIAATKYLKDSINDANTARFKEMQEWRAMAKSVAREIIKE